MSVRVPDGTLVVPARNVSDDRNGIEGNSSSCLSTRGQIRTPGLSCPGVFFLRPLVAGFFDFSLRRGGHHSYAFDDFVCLSWVPAPRGARRAILSRSP